MPTKNEQADLLQVMFGRNSDSPHPDRRAGDARASASTSPSRRGGIALKYMTPVVYLSDAFLATGSEPWRIPSVADLPTIARRERGQGRRPVPTRTSATRRRWPGRGPYPGTAGLEHRIGGLEKADITGNVSYDPDNHHRMQLLRQAKVAGIADDIPPLEVFGPRRATCSSSAGARPMAPSARPSSACTRTAGRSRTPTCAISTRSRPTPRTSSAATGGC